MKLTVGPLPSAVYWRRRAVVFGVLLVAVLLLWSSCSGSSDASNKRGKAVGGASPTPSASVSASSPLFTPSTDGPTGSTDTGLPTQPAPPPQATTAPPAVAVPECSDAQLLVTPAPAAPSVPRGAYLEVTLKVKNIGPQACNRDLGSDAQELYLQSGTTKVWSSDACDAKSASKITKIEASIEHSFHVSWDGKGTAAGCTNRESPAIGKYQLFARVGTKISDPVAVQLT